jgi:SAM-dependent methyltransferase
MIKNATSMESLSDNDKLLIRRRLEPRQGDFEYFVMADIRFALEIIATEEKITVLDYGADLSPYRSLFPNSDYRCADIGGYGASTYLLNNNGTVPEEDCVFDLIISTQVAEHLESPSTYLSECLRLLKPGGKLFLSTHGSYEDHGYPYDYQRWTGDGLKRDLENVGFEVEYINKLTTGPLATIYQIDRCFETCFMSRKTVPGIILWGGRWFMRKFRKYIHKLGDKWFTEYKSVPYEDVDTKIYICLASVSYRPKQSNSA